uniref:Uncharacterized protein n=1 Tax=Glossina palpalis gambiensis TaxID=67801 RepID=A0A1B0C5U8_9MUSC
MSHRTLSASRHGSVQKRSLVEAFTVLEIPRIIVVGMVGYIETPFALRALVSVWAQHLSEECRRCFYKSGLSPGLAK